MMRSAFLVPLILAIFITACDSDENDRPADAPEDTSTPSASETTLRMPGLTLLGQHDLGGSGAADVWANGDVAYVGGRCFSGGVKIVDVSDPASPRLASAAADHPDTSAEDVMVIDARTPFFEGELMAVGLQECPDEEGGEQHGLEALELWDVSDPEEPDQLGRLDVGPVPFGGVHELYLFQRRERVLALLAVPFSEVFHPDGFGDLRIVDVTDPRNPVQIADWGAAKDGGLAFGSPSYEDVTPVDFDPADIAPSGDCTPPEGGEALCRGDIPWVIGHSASASEDGTRAYVSYWDAGMIILDISEPSRPAFIGRTAQSAGDEGNLHSAIGLPGDQLAITTDEDFLHEPEDGVHVPSPGGEALPEDALPEEEGEEPAPRPGDTWGFTRLWDISDPAQPEEIGSFQTPNSANRHTGGIFTVHNPEAHGDLLFLSWYSDGVRILDISEPATPLEVASFVPPASESPDGEEVPPLVWGVHVEGDLVFLSDMSAGLYILRMTGAD